MTLPKTLRANKRVLTAAGTSLLSLSLGFATIQKSYALNVQFLRDSLITEFTAEEMNEFKAFVGEALDTLPDNKAVTWHSQSSALAGKYKARFSYQSEGIQCRRSLFLLGKDQARESYKFDICKIEGKWQIKDTPARHLTQADWDKLENSARLALQTVDIGHPFSWHNEASGHSGVNVVTASYQKNQQLCRDIAISILSKNGTSSNGSYTFCQHTNKEWTRDMTSL
ncbi:MAG TPA: hypothetical protein VIC26_16175 [Marinagarivorans sp.]